MVFVLDINQLFKLSLNILHRHKQSLDTLAVLVYSTKIHFGVLKMRYGKNI